MIITQIKDFTLLWCHKRRTFETQMEDGISLEQFLISGKMITSCCFCVKCPFHLCLWRLYAVPLVLVCSAFGTCMLCLWRLYAVPSALVCYAFRISRRKQSQKIVCALFTWKKKHLATTRSVCAVLRSHFISPTETFLKMPHSSQLFFNEAILRFRIACCLSHQQTHVNYAHSFRELIIML